MRGALRRHIGERGFSLVEVMIGLALGLLIMTALVTLYANISRNNQEMAKANSQVENARFAIQLLKDDFVHAGYWGGFIPQFDDLGYDQKAPDDVPVKIPEPCAAFSDWEVDGANDGILDQKDPYINGLLGIPVQFYNVVPTGCTGLLKNKKSGTDVVLVRHAELCIPGSTNCDPDTSGVLYFQPSRCETEIALGSRYVLGTSGFDLKRRQCDTAGSAPKRKFVSHIYYVRNYAVTVGDGIPTLMRAEFGVKSGTPAFLDPEPLIEGIEDFRIELGIDNVSGTGNNIISGDQWKKQINWTSETNRDSPKNRGDGVPETYAHCAGGCTVAQLANVSAAKIFVLARATEATPGYVDDKTYTLGTQAPLGPYLDGFKRHVFSTTIRFVNISMRRETQ